MSLARSRDGERVMLPEKRPRWDDPDLIRIRSSRMFADKLRGMRTREIAVIYKLSPRHVNREIRAIPEPVKRHIKGAFQRGKLGLGGLHPAG